MRRQSTEQGSKSLQTVGNQDSFHELREESQDHGRTIAESV